jgi:hypothetical protein
LFRLFSKTVAVAFIDDVTGEQVAGLDVPVHQLPDTFALGTELEMAGSHYSVVSAEPQAKADFAKTKRLTVRLRRLEMPDPKSFVFSQPTICGADLPEASVAAIPGDIVILHEDDWRKCEFVASSQSDDISVELSGIRQIHSDEAAAVGWRKVHVRERIARPLPVGTTWSKVAGFLGDFEHIGGVAFGERENTAANAVGARLSDGVVVWSVEEHGQLRVLCVENLDDASVSTVAALKRVADGLSCALIHWCRCEAYCHDVAIDYVAGTLWESAR